MSLRLDDDIIDWFKQEGKGYQSRMNAVLRAYVETQKSFTTRYAEKEASVHTKNHKQNQNNDRPTFY